MTGPGPAWREGLPGDWEVCFWPQTPIPVTSTAVAFKQIILRTRSGRGPWEARQPRARGQELEELCPHACPFADEVMAEGSSGSPEGR